MRYADVVNVTRGSAMGRVRVAARWWQRARGMLGRPAPADGEGLLLVPCRSVHMFGMSYALDIVFLGRDGTVVAIHPRLEPGSTTGWVAEAHMALELAPGAIERTGTHPGDLLRISG